jgi:hypothetical protein
MLIGSGEFANRNERFPAASPRDAARLPASVDNLNAQGERTGGVIWHTTGSGKSLTMVMLAKALSLHPRLNPRVSEHRPHEPG